MAALPFVLLYLVLAVMSALVAGYAWQRRYYLSGRPFTLMLGAIAFWCTCRVFAILGPTFEATVFWALLQVGGIVLVTPAWLLVALAYSGQGWHRRRALLTLLFVPAVLSFVLALTNSLHGLWWNRVEPDMSRGFLWLSITWGPAFWAHSAGTYTIYGVSVFLLARTALLAPPTDRRQAWLMLAASLLPVVGNLAFLAGVHPPWNEDPTPLLLFLSALTAFYATLHFRIIDLNPLVEREALLALPDGMIVLNNRHIVVELNDMAARLLGVLTRTAVGQHLVALLEGSALGEELRPVLSSLASPHTHHVRYETPEGLCTIEVRSRPLQAANGAMSGALLLLRDVSERARAEQAQAQHLAELSMINRVARAANTVADAEGLVRAAAELIADAGLWERVAVGLLSHDGTRLSVVADITADSVGQSFEGGGIAGAEGAALVAILRTGRSQSINLDDPEVAASPLGQGMANQGLRRLLIIPLYHQGTPLGLLALGSLEASLASPAVPRVAETIGELITDAIVRARLYDESRQAERLKASFLASVSHELRTPLTSIIGYVEMLQRNIYGPLPEPMREPLGYTRLASGTLLRLINDILDFSRTESGHLRIELAPVDVLHAVANVVGQMQPQIVERGLDFDLDIPPGLPRVWGNQTRLEQIVSNLLGNAVKFTDQGKISVSATLHGGRLHLSVTDTGVGIEPEHLGVIFQEFRRVEMPGRYVGGTGLGLAITKRLVGLMGGTISVQSTLGVGSIFTLDLEVAREIAEGQGAASRSVARQMGD